MEVLTMPASQSATCYNPLLDVKIPEAVLSPGLDYPDLKSQEASTPIENKKSEAIIGADSQHLAPPSFSHPLASRSRDRNPLQDIKLPNAVIASEFHAVPTPSLSPTLRSARKFSSLSCPPQLLPQEWNAFMTELESAASLSTAKQTFAVAIGIAAAVGPAVDDSEITWGKYHDVAIGNENAKSPRVASFDSEWKRESVGVVVERWNARWASRGIRVALEGEAREK